MDEQSQSVVVVEGSAEQSAPPALVESTPEVVAGGSIVARLARGRKQKKEDCVRNSVGHMVSLEEIDRALVKFKGDRGKSAQFLNMERKVLNWKVNQCKWLKQRWRKYSLVGPGVKSVITGDAPPDTISTVSRESPVPANPDLQLALKKEEELAAAIAREDKKVKEGLLLMGCSDDEAQLAISLRSFHGRHISKTVDMMTAGVSMNSLKVLSKLRMLEKRLEAGAPGGEFPFAKNERGDPVEERMTWEMYQNLLKEYRQMTELALKGSITLAKIDAMKREAEGGKRRGRPGFPAKGDTNTQVIANNVVIQP